MEITTGKKVGVRFAPHNYFAVACGKDYALALNEVFDVGEFMGKKLGYGSYLALGDGTGGGRQGLKSQRYVLKTTPVNVNTDLLKGRLRATFTATLNENEAEGFTLTEMGLTGYAPGGRLANYAVVAPVTKKAGERLTVSVTVNVRLVNNSERACFTGGSDNPITRFFAGFPLEEGTLSLKNAFTLWPNEVVDRGSENTVSSSNKDFSMTVDEANKCMVFDCRLINYNYTEYIYYMNERSILRMLWPYTPTIKTLTASATERGYVMVTTKSIDEVVGITQNGVELAAFDQLRPTGTPLPYKPNIEFKLPANARFIQDQRFRAGLIIADSELILVTASKDCMVQKLRLPYNGEDAGFTYSGKLYVWGEKLAIYSFDAAYGKYTVQRFDVPRGQKGLVVAEGPELYHLMTKEADRVKRYKLEEGVLTLLETTEVAAPFDIFRSMQSLGYAALSGARYVKNLRGTMADAQAAVDLLYREPGTLRGLTAYDGYICGDFGTFQFILNVTAKMADAVRQPVYRLNQKSVVEQKPEGWSVCYINDISTGIIRVNYGFAVSDVMRIDKNVFILTPDGTVKHYVTDESYIAAYSPSIKSGSATVTYRARQFVASPARQRLTIGFTQGG